MLNRTFQCLLAYNNSVPFDGDSTYEEIAAAEVTAGDGGYARLDFSYTAQDIEEMVSGIVSGTKRAIFIHDGSVNPIIYDHFVIVEKIPDGASFTYDVVAIQPLGVTGRLVTGGEEAHFVINGRHKNI